MAELRYSSSQLLDPIPLDLNSIIGLESNQNSKIIGTSIFAPSLIPELIISSVSLRSSTKTRSLGLGISHFSLGKLNTLETSLAWHQQVSPKLTIGTSLGLLSQKIYNRRSIFVSPRLLASYKLTNSLLSASTSILNKSIKIGYGQLLSNHIIGIEAIIQPHIKPEMRLVTSVRASESLRLQAAVDPIHWSTSSTAIIQTRSISYTIYIEYKPITGLSSSISIWAKF